MAKVLLAITPAGFEEFFRRMGQPAESPEVPELQQPSPEWFEKVARVGQEFGAKLM